MGEAIRSVVLQSPCLLYLTVYLTTGDLVYAEFFGHGTLIINSQHIAHELLEKRGSKYSGRPRLTMLREV